MMLERIQELDVFELPMVWLGRNILGGDYVILNVTLVDHTRRARPASCPKEGSTFPIN
jgi:hypothetical protein